MSTNENSLIKNLKEDNDFSVWKIKKNLQSDEIIPKMNHYLSITKTNTNILLDERKREKINNRTKLISRNLKRNISESILFEKEISPYSKILLSKIGKYIKYIKKSTSEISKLNEIILEKSSNNESNIKNNNLENNNISNNNIIDNKLSKNFSYINNKYRRQFNNAFLRFNPITYMNNLKIIEKADPEIKKDIDSLKKNIDDEIKELTDIHRMKKKYNQFIENNKNKKMIISKSTNNLIELNKPLALSPLTHKNSKNNIDNKYSILTRRSIFNKKKFNIDGKVEEMEKIIDCANSISELIDKSNIKNNIDKSLSQYALDNYHQFNEEHKRIEPKNFFKRQNNIVFQQLIDIKALKIDKKVLNEQKNIQKQIKNLKNQHLNKVNQITDWLKKDLNSNLEKYKINLDNVY